MTALRIVPLTRSEAQRFIAEYHRHNRPSISAVFQIGVEQDGKLVGVAMVGVPKARKLMDGRTLEVMRVCTNGARNGCSILYGASARAAKALGWSRLVTYTLASEPGSSLRASGWVADPDVFEHDQSRWLTSKSSYMTDLFGVPMRPQGPKRRWWKQLRPPPEERL